MQLQTSKDSHLYDMFFANIEHRMACRGTVWQWKVYIFRDRHLPSLYEFLSLNLQLRYTKEVYSTVYNSKIKKLRLLSTNFYGLSPISSLCYVPFILWKTGGAGVLGADKLSMSKGSRTSFGNTPFCKYGISWVLSPEEKAKHFDQERNIALRMENNSSSCIPKVQTPRSNVECQREGWQEPRTAH